MPGTHSIPRLLVLGAGERPPQALLAIGHKAQGQLLGHQPLHQTFRVGEIFLAPVRRAVRLRLGQMQGS